MSRGGSTPSPALVPMVLLSLIATGCRNPDCEEWIGTWRGSFSGTVMGYSFSRSSSDFQLEIREYGNTGSLEVRRATWLLAGGYALEFSYRGPGGSTTFECSDLALSLSDSYGFLVPPTGDSDNSEFRGSLSRTSRSGSGSWVAPAATDKSPTFTGDGQWSLGH